MSAANVTIGHVASQKPAYWQPAFTRHEAARIGISKDEYDQAYLYARMAVEEHQSLGTPRDRWEPTPTLNERLAAPFITDAEEVLARRLETEADPALDKSQGLIENVKANLDETSEHAGASYSAARAVERVCQYDMKIRRDETVGKHHHRRASVLSQRLASWSPWVEATAFLTFVAYYLNVPLLQPWRDWLGWSFAVTVAVVIIVGQSWLVRHAARSHNHAREARADSNRHHAEQGIARSARYIGLAAVPAMAITGGMIWRGITALGNASIYTTAVMVFAATVTGLLLPTLAYFGIALDGSDVSRERDRLVADLDDDLDEYLKAISNSRRNLADVAEIGDTLRDKTFPDICNKAQAAVDAVYGLYGIVRLFIRDLSAEPPSKMTETVSQDADGIIRGYIGTSIPGSHKVYLGPLFDRENRLAEIQRQRTDLLERIEALPPHPWGTSRVAAEVVTYIGAAGLAGVIGNRADAALMSLLGRAQRRPAQASSHFSKEEAIDAAKAAVLIQGYALPDLAIMDTRQEPDGSWRVILTAAGDNLRVLVPPGDPSRAKVLIIGPV